MALIKCPVCGKEFSEYADCCPECSCPVETAKGGILEETPQYETEQSINGNPKKLKNTPKKQHPQQNISNRLVIAVVILSLVVIGLLIAFLVIKCSQDSINETTQTEIQQSGFEDGNKQPSYSDYETRYDYVCNRYVRDSDLIGVSKEELRIMRNWIFARHGYIFKSKDLQEYFGQFSWYHPRYADVTSMLSDIEITNIDFIKRYE